MRWVLLFLVFNNWSLGQNNILVIGNYQNIRLSDTLSISYEKNLPDSISQYQSIFLFSTANSSFSSIDLDRIIEYVEYGGGLYCGADNFPLQAEANQLTERIYNKKMFGENSSSLAKAAEFGNLNLDAKTPISAGETTSSFPLDHRLAVEAWQDDQALISSGYIGLGRIVIDGGYSRFYKSNSHKSATSILEEILYYLNKY